MNFSFQLTVKIGRHCPRRGGTFDAVIVKGRPLSADAYGSEGMRQTPTQRVVQQQVEGDTAARFIVGLPDGGERGSAERLSDAVSDVLPTSKILRFGY